MPTTATEWLESHPESAEALEEMLDGLDLPFSVLTELPEPMKRMIVRELGETFGQDYWRNIAETTAGDAERILEEGLQEGRSIRQMARELMEELGGDRYAETRVYNIARTESGNALNGARKGVVDQLAEDIPEAKVRAEWLSVLGTTTRPAHAELDGVPADEDGLWNLDGMMVPWPGHFSLPANMRCGCQCSIVTSFGMDEDEARSLISDYEQRVEEFGGEEAIDDLQEKGDLPGHEFHGNQWTDGMGGTMRGDDGKLRMADGSPLPDYIPKNIPPAWKNVVVATDPSSDLLVKGVDAKGRTQSIYSDSHNSRQAAAKFARINELRSKQESIMREVDRDLSRGDSRTKENAAVLRLINHTGIRPGGEGDTGAEKQAYGATTLLGQHIVRTGGEVRLQFVGKKGVDLDIPVKDASLAKDLLSRAGSAGRDGRVFATDSGSLRDYVHSKDGGSFKPKDFRTAKAAEVAISTIDKMSRPKTVGEYKKAVREVAKVVSSQLGNTPTVALQSYIPPAVFSKWRIK